MALGRSFQVTTEASGRIVADELLFFLDEVRRSLIRRHSKPFVNPTHAPATGEEHLLRRRGGILGITTRVRGSTQTDKVRGQLHIPFPISVHEEGATIRPRRAQFLTIPLPAALDSRGRPLRPRARDWDDTFVKRSSRGNLIIFKRVGGRLVPLYLLKREVRLPARLEAAETLAAGANFFEENLANRLAAEILRRAGSG